MQVVRIEVPRLQYLDGYLKLPTAKGAVFAELLPEVAVRHVAGNSTLYSVVYRRPKKKKDSAVKKLPKKHAPKLLKGKQVAETDVSSPLIVTVYQSDVRAKKFRVLLKMKVDVRLTTADKSYRFGVAVAVDEVAACVYAVYTRDEAPVGKRPTPGTRLLLRRVQLTLAAADERGVRWLQRPGRQGVSKMFEAKAYVTKMDAAGTPLKLMANRLKAKEGVVVQQLVIDKGSLLLFSQWVASTAFKVKDNLEVALLKLNEKRSSMDVHSLPQNDVLIFGHGRRKFMVGPFGVDGSPREVRADKLVLKPYLPAPSLTKLGTVADAACRRLGDALQDNSVACQQIVGGGASSDIWSHASARRRHQVFLSISRQAQVVVVRGLTTVAPQPQIVSARLIPLAEGQPPRHFSVDPEVRTPLFNVSGSWLLVFVPLQRARQPSAIKLVLLRASLRSLLPPKTVCANCNVDLRPTPPDKKKVCKVCRIRGFGQYSWVFGCHFCSAACLRDAWPQHSRLHQTPPLRKWTDADWKKWRRDNSQP